MHRALMAPVGLGNEGRLEVWVHFEPIPANSRAASRGLLFMTIFGSVGIVQPCERSQVAYDFARPTNQTCGTLISPETTISPLYRTDTKDRIRERLGVQCA